jgi:FtsP/CotA-like multicopper oxidase with cupredoxin domain
VTDTSRAQGFNNISFQNQINYPLLEQVEDGHAINGKLVANVAFTEIGGGDIIINNLDNVIAHPFHLHGGTFWILGRGTGNITAKEAGKLKLNTHNPLRRDTLQMNLGEWALLRESGRDIHT